MPRKKKKRRRALVQIDPYAAVLKEVVELLETARHKSARAVNTLMTSTYWRIGKRIVEAEQAGSERADYGDRLLDNLSRDLHERFGRGFSATNLRYFRSFYLEWPIQQTLSAELANEGAVPFPLPWSHYVRLLAIENSQARNFYEMESLRSGWTVRQLHRQIGSMFYERTALSRNKAAMLTKHNRRKPDDRITVDQEVKDPFVLEFLGLKDEYSESELEDGLIRHLETFLLELGGEFTFIGRQRRLRIGRTWYRIDLLLFHRVLRCLVIIDLKTREFEHADAGQMHLYCNYAKAHWMMEGENPPVGLILCTEKDEVVAQYALDGLPNKIMAARYKTALPDEKVIAAELKQTRKLLETRRKPQANR